MGLDLLLQHLFQLFSNKNGLRPASKTLVVRSKVRFHVTHFHPKLRPHSNLRIKINNFGLIIINITAKANDTTDILQTFL